MRSIIASIFKRQRETIKILDFQQFLLTKVRSLNNMLSMIMPIAFDVSIIVTLRTYLTTFESLPK